MSIALLPLRSAQAPNGGSTERANSIAIFDADDPNILYHGRWDLSTPKAPQAGWQGSSILIHFEGTDLYITLDAGSKTEYFRVIIDDDVLGSSKIAVTSGKSDYHIASGMADGTHKVEIVKESYGGTHATFYGFRIHGGRLLTPPGMPERRIEFYGDSNLAGQSLESEKDEGDNALVGTVFGYAGITARMFDASYHNISSGGATISSLHDKYDQIAIAMSINGSN